MAASELAKQVLAQLRVTDDAERNLTQLFNATEADSLEQLANVLLALLRSGTIELFYRVHGRYDGSGIEDYDDPAEIPKTITDPWADPPLKFRVTPSDVEVVYRAAKSVGGGATSPKTSRETPKFREA